jgi:hypothetical protein
MLTVGLAIIGFVIFNGLSLWVAARIAKRFPVLDQHFNGR